MSSVSSSSPVPQDVEKCPASISFSLLTSVAPDTPTAKLAIGVESCTDLPGDTCLHSIERNYLPFLNWFFFTYAFSTSGRDYGAHCDPWVSIAVNRERRSLRRRPASPITQFRTKTIRHAHNPFYSQTFVTELQRVDMKDVSVVFTVMDQDRHCGAVEIGKTSITLREAKQTVEDPVKFSAHSPIIQTKKVSKIFSSMI